MATVPVEPSTNRVGTAESCGGREVRAALESFVRGGSVAAVPAAQLIDSGLAGYAVARAEALGEPLNSSVTMARVAMAARHLVAKRYTSHLVRAWVDAGLDVLLFKGFALAEFVYQDPTSRHYSDVDVALRPTVNVPWAQVATRAADAAAAVGFDVFGRPEMSRTFDSFYGSSYRGPALFQLVHRTSRVSVDVHQRVVHNTHDENGSVTKQERITEAVWQNSQSVALADVPIRIPAPVDSAVVGLILSRSWSPDSNRLRPQDYLDLVALRELHGIDRSNIEHRARELGCSTSARLFLRRCDPGTRCLDLRPPSALERLYFDTLLAHEHGHRAFQLRMRELRHLPARALRTSEELPNVVSHLHEWRTGPPQRWPAEILPDGDTPLDRESWRLTQFALRRAFQLCGVLHPERHHDLALAALLYALRKRGVPAMRGDSGGAAEIDGRQPAPVLMLDGEVLRPTVLGIRL